MAKKTFVTIGLLAGLAVFGILVLSMVLFGWNPSALFGANAQAVEANLKVQLQEIRSPEAAHFIAQRRTIKESHGAVSNEYRTELAFDQIRRFYDVELSGQGWELRKETEVLWDRQNYGGKHVFYCKGELTADLEYAGKMESEFGWTYALSLTWGLRDPCR